MAGVLDIDGTHGEGGKQTLLPSASGGLARVAIAEGMVRVSPIAC